MRVLVACEVSGKVRDAFIRAGHDAMSCDLVRSDRPGPHHVGDVREILYDGWDLLIAFPPCTYLCFSGIHWENRRPERRQHRVAAIEFVRLLLNAPIEHIAVENPVGVISREIRPPDQIIQPYLFGHDASKKTCLWLKNLPKLKPTNPIPPNYWAAHGHPRWSNQTTCGRNGMGSSVPNRSKKRSETYDGIAEAMAQQWPGPSRPRQRTLLD